MSPPGEQCPQQESCVPIRKTHVPTSRVAAPPGEPWTYQESSVPTRRAVSSPGEHCPQQESDVPPGSQPGSQPCSQARLPRAVQDTPCSGTELEGFAVREGQSLMSCTGAPIYRTGRVSLSKRAAVSFPLRSRFSHFTSFLHLLYCPLFFSFLLSTNSCLPRVQRRLVLKARRPRCPAATAAQLPARPAPPGPRQ